MRRPGSAAKAARACRTVAGAAAAAPTCDTAASSSGPSEMAATETDSAVVMAYSVLTDGWLLPVSIWETRLAETPISRARERRLTPLARRACRMRAPTGGTAAGDTAAPLSGGHVQHH